jgi:hypothetical protein
MNRNRIISPIRILAPGSNSRQQNTFEGRNRVKSTIFLQQMRESGLKNQLKEGLRAQCSGPESPGPESPGPESPGPESPGPKGHVTTCTKFSGLRPFSVQDMTCLRPLCLSHTALNSVKRFALFLGMSICSE